MCSLLVRWYLRAMILAAHGADFDAVQTGAQSLSRKKRR
jgi:hypothetical protein